MKNCSIPPIRRKREPTVDLVVGAPPARGGTESPVFRVRETRRTVTRLRLICGFWKRYLTSLLPTPFGPACWKFSGKTSCVDDKTFVLLYIGVQLFLVICLKSVSQRWDTAVSPQKRPKFVFDTDNPYHVACLINAAYVYM